VLGLEIVVVLGAAVLICSGLASRLHVAPPILLLVSGILLGFVPALREVQLPPEVVLFLFLPALLFWESLTTSLREIKANLRGIVLTCSSSLQRPRWRRWRTSSACPGAPPGCSALPSPPPMRPLSAPSRSRCRDAR
jgi:hypothetical protein